MVTLFKLLLSALFLVAPALGFVTVGPTTRRESLCWMDYREFANDNDEDIDRISSSSDFEVNDFGDQKGEFLEDLSWRVEKLRLEEENKKRFLKARPIFLPYKDASKWVQAWGKRWTSKAEWDQWIADGEKRNSYIPSKPEEYYSRTGEWSSWDHFLGILDDDN